MSALLTKTHQDSTKQEKVQGSHSKYSKEDIVAEIRIKLIQMKKHLCDNKDEVDNFHPSWFCIPSDDTIKEIYIGSVSAERAYLKLLLDMYTPLLLELGIENDPPTLHFFRYDLRMFVYSHQALKLDMAFDEKYNISCISCNGDNDVMHMYHSARMKGHGRLDTLGKMHLSCFGDFEVAGADDWDLEDESIIGLCINAKDQAV